MAVSTLDRRQARSNGAAAPTDPVTLAKALLEQKGYRVEQARSFGSYLRQLVTAKRYPGSDAPARLEKEWGSPYVVQKAAMGESGGGTIGGYLVPQEFSLRLLRSFAEESFIYPRADVIPMTSSETLAPYMDVETAQAAGTAPWFGGLLCKWGATDTPSESEPKFKQKALHSWNLTCYAVASNQWLTDTGPEGEERLFTVFGRAAAYYAEYAFINGLGAANIEPLGVLQSPALLTATRSGGNLIAAADIAAVAARLIPASWRTAIWVTHPTCLAQIAKAVTYFVNSDGEAEGRDGRCGQLMGRPMFVSDKVPSLGKTGDLLLMDPALYTVGDRQQVLIDVSDSPGFQNYQTTFRVWLRMDGFPTLANEVTLTDGATLATAYVALAA